MEFETLIKERYSLRSYSDKELSEEVLDKIIEAGRIAPSAKNFQAVKVFILQSEEALKKAELCTVCRFKAPVMFLFTYDKDNEYRNPEEVENHSGVQDVSIMATQMMLEASNLGLGTCWINKFSIAKTKEVFKLPDNLQPVLFMDLGYPDEKAVISERHNQRKEKEEIFSLI